MNKRDSIIIINAIAFILIYGAILSMYIYPYEHDTIWLSMVLVGGILNVIKYIKLKIRERKRLVKLIFVDTTGIICIVIILAFFSGTFNDSTNDFISLLVTVLVSIPILIYNRKTILANTDAE